MSTDVDPALDLVNRGLPCLRGALEQIRCISFAASQEFCTPGAMAVMLRNVADELQVVYALLERWSCLSLVKSGHDRS